MKNTVSNTLMLETQSELLRNNFALVRRGLSGKTILPITFEIKDEVEQPLAQAKSNPRNIRFTGSAFLKPITGVFKRIIDKVAVLAIAVSVLVGLVLIVPQVYYAFAPVDTIPVESTEEHSALGGSFEEGTQAVEEVVEAYMPEKDETLPEGEWLIIPRIGVRTQLNSTIDSEEALATGVWDVPGYGEPGSTDLPVILAAHRFGWEWWWQSDYWKYNSFYLLPDTEPGDTIEIISDQRKWVYEIYGGAEGDAIADYDADLILYTCKFLSSPVRHFRYARLLDPTVDTQ